jgi:hypothetical protein
VTADRTSRLTRGTSLLHADLHNHTLLSDGAGDPARAFASMRAAGLDVAALTDHASLDDTTMAAVRAGATSLPSYVHPARGIAPDGWLLTAELADAADRPGEFTAIRGFEWTTPTLGHANVWGSEGYTDVIDVERTQPFFDWLAGPGADGAVAGFNHPGREPGRFEDFRFVPAAREQLVSLEIFNRWDDYLFEGYVDSRPSPLCSCLDAGWRPGLSGVTDEHGDDWGLPEGKGRTGLWTREHSRAGVFEALRARRFFATRVSGLRVDATANGVRMGSVLRHTRGDVEFALDVDRGDAWEGSALEVQVLRPGPGVPEVADVVAFSAGRVVRFRVELALEDGAWVVLRVADPSEPNDAPGPAGHPANNLAVAYTSPWFLEPAAAG